MSSACHFRSNDLVHTFVHWDYFQNLLGVRTHGRTFFAALGEIKESNDSELAFHYGQPADATAALERFLVEWAQNRSAGERFIADSFAFDDLDSNVLHLKDLRMDLFALDSSETRIWGVSSDLAKQFNFRYASKEDALEAMNRFDKALCERIHGG